MKTDGERTHGQKPVNRASFKSSKRFVALVFGKPLLFLLFLTAFLSPQLPSFTVASEILCVTIDGVINPVTADFLDDAIRKARFKKAGALVVQLDTPGGLDLSMREMIKDMLSSEVPVIVFSAPAGSRAASAGVFITYAASIAAMAPGTNIDSAHPVSMAGKMDETMAKKVENDAVAYLKGIAAKRGRNAEWAEKAVRDSVNVTAEEALKLGVINMLASTRAFGKIVSSMVNDILMPPIGKMMGGVNFADKFVNLSGGEYPSLKAAKDAGAAVISYGQFINVVIDFIIVAFCIFLMIKAMNALKKSKEMMRENKMQLFLLWLSFLGWAVCCVFTFGIGFLWLIPYVTLSVVNFYEEVRAVPAGGTLLRRCFRKDKCWPTMLEVAVGAHSCAIYARLIAAPTDRHL